MGLHIVQKRNPVFFQGGLTAEAVGQKNRSVRKAESHHIKRVPRQRDHLHLPGEFRIRETHGLAFRRHQKLVAQPLQRTASIQKGWFQNGMPGKSSLDPLREDLASVLLLQIMIASDMIRMGMGIQNPLQMPALLVQDLSDPAAGILVAAAVDQIHFCFCFLINSDFRGTLDVITLFPRLDQFVHMNLPVCFILPDYPAP